MEGMSPEQISHLTQTIRANTIIDYFAASTVAIIFFDYLHTLPREVNLMWPMRLSIPKVLYFVLRYWIMVHSIWWMTYHGNDTLTGSQCSYPFSRNSVSSQTILILCEAISYIRVYAFSGGNKYLLVFLSAHFMAINAIGFYHIVVFIRSATFIEFPPELVRLGCFPKAANGFSLFIIVLTLLISLLTVTVLMVFFGIRRYRSGSSTLVKVFYQHGIFYFLCLSALQIANIIVFLSSPAEGLQLLVVQPGVHFSALLATRMLLHLREWGEKQRIIIVQTENSNYVPPPETMVGSGPFLSAPQFAMNDLSSASSEGTATKFP